MKKKILLFALATLGCTILLYAQKLNKSFACTDGPVFATLVNGDSVYIGGNFYNVGIGTQHLARFKPGSARPEADFPQINDNNANLNAIESDEAGGFYLAGYISNFNGNYINPSAIIHVLSNGVLDSSFLTVNIDYSYNLNSLKKKGDTLFIAGGFNYVQGVYRPYLAALNANTGALLNWQPAAPNSNITKIEVNNSLVFITGSFNQVGSATVPYGFAALDIKNGTLVTDFPTANSYVTAIDADDSAVFLGGSFSSIGYEKEGFAKANLGGSKFSLNFPSTDGNVQCILPDGKGGYYIGGAFSNVGNTGRGNIAHILSTGKIDLAFYVNANSAVYSITADSNNLYLGGSFTSINGAVRNHIASVSLTTGTLNNFNPNTNGEVRSIIYNKGVLYFGGSFSLVKGKVRNNAAAVTTDNKLTSWSPDANGAVNCIVLNPSSTSAYLGGEFNTIKGKPHSYLAKVNTTNGNPFNWQAAPDNSVNSMALSGSNLYIKGLFYYINGIPRNSLAAIDTVAALPTSFYANLYDYTPTGYNDLSIYNGKLYVGGSFASIQDSVRTNLARIDIATGKVDNWNAGNVIQPNNAVYVVTADENGVAFGGSFNFLGNTARNGFVEIGVSTPDYKILHWQPQANFNYYGNATDILHYKKDVFVCGSFGYTYTNGIYAGQTMYNVLAVNDSTGEVSREYSQYPGYPPNSMCIFDNKLMIEGVFNDFYDIVNSSNSLRPYLTGYNLADNQLTSALYNPNSQLHITTDAAGNLITAGSFTLMNSLNRQYLACINLKTGLPVLWNPSPSGPVYALAAKDSTLFAAGSFYSIGSNHLYRQNIAAINTKNDEAITTWNAPANDNVYALAVKENILYAGGAFTNIKNTNRKYAAALSASDAQLTEWNPSLNNYVNSILPLNNYVYLGGYFTKVKGNNQQYLAKTDNQTGLLINWKPNPNSRVSHIIASGKNVYVTGGFSQIASQPRKALAAFDSSTNQLTSFDARINYNSFNTCTLGPVVARGKALFFGGDYYFNSVGDSSRQYLAGIDTSSAEALSFNPTPDQPFNYYYSISYNSMFIAKNKLFIGGNWSTISSSLSNPFFAVYNLSALPDEKIVNPLITQTVSADLTFKSVTANVYPNPAHSECIVAFTGKENEQYSLNVADMKGNIIQQMNVTSIKVLNTVHLKTGNLANGNYIINISDRNGLVKSLKLIKE